MAKKKSARGGKREGAGRPLVAGKPRSVYLHHRVTDDEKARWQAAATADDPKQSLSEWIRKTLDDAAAQAKPGRPKKPSTS